MIPLRKTEVLIKAYKNWFGENESELLSYFEGCMSDQKSDWIRQKNREKIQSLLFGTSYGKCAYCERKPDEGGGNMEIDHFYPKKTEAFRGRAFDFDNLLPACKQCNTAKGQRYEDPKGNEIINPYNETDMAVHLALDQKNMCLNGISRKGKATVGILEDGGANTFVGGYSGMNAGNGNRNVYVGYGAGLSATGDRNVFLGYQAGQEETGSNKLYIANSETDTPLIYGEFDNNLVAVNGTVKTREVIVENTAWPDYVLKDGYRPMPLDELERNIKKNGHLPDIPSAEEVEKNGVSLGEMQAKLLQKIEELTLHVIEQSKRLDQQNRKLEQLQNENGMLKNQVSSLQSVE